MNKRKFNKNNLANNKNSRNFADNFRREFGKYLLDISKLIFGGSVIAGIMKENINLVYVILVGILATFGIALWGFILTKQIKIK